jgi:hypothetical protein
MIKTFDPEECVHCIAEDWARDTKGIGKLTCKAFCDAFFELAGEAHGVIMPCDCRAGVRKACVHLESI